MQQGNEEWEFFERELQDLQLQAALAHYAAAYEIHPRNRDAVAALNRVGEALLGAAGEDRDQRRAAAELLRSRSEYYRKYRPVIEALE
jgi:hypothetical protein